MKNRPLSLQEKRAVREYYAGDYHQLSDYTNGHPWHEVIAEYRVLLTRAVFKDLGKVLDAGCAGGEEVLAFRKHGVDAWGFDICPDLPDIVYPEARPYVRIGRLDFVPYGPEDGFRTLVSHDVFEHAPIDALERLPDELLRLGIRQVSCIVSNDELNEGHITIQDTDYYVALMARAGFRLMTELDDGLQQVVTPAGWDESTQTPICALYTHTGQPTNGWNRVPGHLFFTRDPL